MSDYQFNPSVEQWKAIPGFPGYDVSDHGRVRSYWKGAGPQGQAISDRSQRILKTQKYEDYLLVSIRHNGRRITRRVHRLVLLAFVGPCLPGDESCHSDGIGSNNKFENLRYDTHRNNTLEKIKHNTLLRGETIGNHKLTENKASKIRELASQGLSQISISRLFDVSPMSISLVVRHKIWKHVP